MEVLSFIRKEQKEKIMLTVKDLKDLKGKRVYVRVDFNVPQTNGVIRDTNRIKAALPTIQELLSKGARVILMSHLGKIKWKEPDPEKIEAMKKANDMAPVAKALAELLPGVKVSFCPATRGEELTKAVAALKDGEILLGQNTRYEKGEEKNDPELAQIWASLADVFVMDAFGSAHRAHASTVGVPSILKAEGKPVALGYLMIKEVENLTRCVEVKDEDRPYVAVLGGLKVSDKIKVIDTLLNKCDYIIIGGAMAYTFRKARGEEIGKSFLDADSLDYAKACLEKAKGKKKSGMMSKVWKAVLTAITSTFATILGTYVSDKVTGKKTKSKTSATGRVVKNATSAATRSITKELTRDILGNLVK